MPVDFSKIPSPCFVIDEQLLEQNLQLIKGVADATGVEIILAFKGFAMWSVFPLVRKYIKGAAASSVNEARLAVEEMKTKAHTYSAVFTQEEFNDILEYSSHVTFNSLAQFHRFNPEIESSKKKVSIGLRVNPEFSEVSTALYNPCSPGSRLGVTAEALGEQLPADIEGFHFHALCEGSAVDLEKVLFSVEQKFGKFFSRLKWINMGGGHLMTRKDYDVELLKSTLINFKKRYPHLHVILEPGAAFAWETGYLVSTVQDMVVNGGIKTAMLDVSFTAHMPDCLEMPYKPRIIGATDELAGKPTYRMGGNSCLSGDFVGNWSFDNELKVGDAIIFEDMIHYTMVKTTFFNGVTHPVLGRWNDKTGFQLVRKFGYRDYKAKLS